MTEELKQLREALRRVKYEAVSLADAQVIALEALTAAQPAQEVAAVNTREQTFQNGYRIGYQAGRASLPTQSAAQATRTTADTLREIKAASCKDCGASGYTDPGEADSPDGPGRPAVVCGACMGTGWRDGVHISDQQATPASADDMEVYDGMAADYFADARQAAPESLTGCNCRWKGDTQVEWCEHHRAHLDAIHEWAQRAKSAEARLKATPEPVEHKCRHCGVTTIEDEDGITMLGLPAPDRPIMFDPSADVPIPAPGVPDVEDLRDRLVAISAAQAKGGGNG